VLYLVSPDQRKEVLTLASKNEETECAKRAAHGEWVLIDIAESDTPGLRHWHTIERLQSLVVQVFTRRIANNNSPTKATKLLYAQHRYGRGSGLLEDYLPRDSQ
jgi:hypothetical protein